MGEVNDSAKSTPDEKSPSHLRAIWCLFRDAGMDWHRDNAMRLSAAVAMYTVLSLSPLLVITLKVLSFFLGSEAAQRYTNRQALDLLGPEGAKAVEQMIASVSRPGSGLVATAISAGILIFSASGVFSELRASLNHIWNVEPKGESGWWTTIRNRLLSISMVFVIGFLLLTSQIITTTLTAAAQFAGSGVDTWSFIIDVFVSTLVIAMLFACIFRFLPDVKIAWRDLILGSLVTAILFKAGQYLQSLYFTYGTPTSAYGAAGSLMAVLLWVYYSCWVLFFGAELTQAFVRLNKREIAASSCARKLKKPDMTEKGTD